MKAIPVRDIESQIIALGRDIEREKNTKEKARLVDEQAALKLTIRVMQGKVRSVSIRPNPVPAIKE
jgi:hypothetical protein